jgi:hypothetical protein
MKNAYINVRGKDLRNIYRVYVISDILNNKIKVSLLKTLTIFVMTHTLTAWGSALKKVSPKF